MVERWIVTAEGRDTLRPFMWLEWEERRLAEEVFNNMKASKWRNRRIWHYVNGDMKLFQWSATEGDKQ